ncbi:MAG: hypothetical protein K0S44_2944, partial [Bacteroidetes bacterium]|nr:hypothetical protein [Bacteroidota bacterium]
MKRILLIFIIFLAGIFDAYATHIRAGEIIYRWISGYTYEITAITYSNTLNTTTDDCEIKIHFGDGDTAIVPRSNGPVGSCSPGRMGVMFTSVANTKYNEYKTVHTYSGPGIYLISSLIQNRNAGICNIPSSVYTPVAFQTDLIINPFLTPNSSPVLLNPPIDQACVGQCFEHNPGAYDSDGDSLYYRLDTCLRGVGTNVSGWTYPPIMSANSIDHRSGDLVWCVPTSICQYNIVIVIEEWKLLLTTQKRYYVGSILRDMQIDVVSCSNTAPTIIPVPDVCIVAGSNLS